VSVEQFINKVHNGHVLGILKLMPSKSVDCVVTSPPYWGLRNYGDITNIIWGGNNNCEHEWGGNILVGKSTSPTKWKTSDENIWKGNSSNFCIKCGAWNGQLGLEPHPNIYIEHLVEIFREVKRVLKDSGSLWLNIGDTYYGGGRGQLKSGLKTKGKITVDEFKSASSAKDYIPNKQISKWLQPKQQLMIPERVAIELQNRGWIKRNTIIWHKNNAMPSSVKDRLNTTYEPVFFFVKNRKYYFDLDSIRVNKKYPTERTESLLERIYELTKLTRGKDSYKGKDKTVSAIQEGSKPYRDALYILIKEIKLTKSELKYLKDWVQNHAGSFKGKNPGDKWTINTKPCREAHFAVFPDTLVERILKCVCPIEVCSKCGKSRKKISKSLLLNRNISKPNKPSFISVTRAGDSIHKTIGWTKCKCDKPFNAGIVLDPFMGSGTTGMVAKQMGLNFIGIELNREYCNIADKRIGGVEIVEYPINRQEFTKYVENKKDIKIHKLLREGSKCNYSGKCMWQSFNRQNCLRKDNKCIKEK